MFTKISVSKSITNQNQNIVIQIVKYKKERTKRLFFSPTINGKRLTKTMFARRGDAEDLARFYVREFSNNSLTMTWSVNEPFLFKAKGTK